MGFPFLTHTIFTLGKCDMILVSCLTQQHSILGHSETRTHNPMIESVAPYSLHQYCGENNAHLKSATNNTIKQSTSTPRNQHNSKLIGSSDLLFHCRPSSQEDNSAWLLISTTILSLYSKSCMALSCPEAQSTLTLPLYVRVQRRCVPSKNRSL